MNWLRALFTLRVMESREAHFAVLARMICERNGLDPWEFVRREDGARVYRWTLYVDRAQAVWESALSEHPEDYGDFVG